MTLLAMAPAGTKTKNKAAVAKRVAKSKAKAAPKKQRGEKRTLLEREAEAAAATRGRKKNDERAALMKLMNDHFRSLSNEEKYVMRIQGLTLEEKLRVDRQAWLNGEIAMGMNYYSELRRVYSTEETPYHLIKVLNNDEEGDDDLEEAIFQASRHQADCEPLKLWLAKEELPNQRVAAGLMKGIVIFDPYANGARSEVLLEVLKWCHTVSFDKAYPEIWQHVKPHFGKVLDKSWTTMKSSGVSQRTWWKSVRGFVEAIIDVDAWEACVNADKDWGAVKAELRRVSETIVGQRVFAKGLQDIAAGSTSDMIDEAIGEMAATTVRITQASLKKFKDQLEAKLKESGSSLHKATKPRGAPLTYRGVSFPVQVSSALEEYTLKVWAKLKGVGCKKGMLANMFCEADLVDDCPETFAADIDPGLFDKPALAREEAKGFVEAEEQSSAVEIKDALTQNHKVLSSLDPTWKIELNFWLSQCGSKGEERLRNKVLGVLPTPTVEVTLAASLTGIKKIVGTKLYQFVGVGLRSEISTVQGWINTMHQNRNPNFAKVQTGVGFYQQVIGMLPNYARQRNARGDTLVGRAALELMIRNIGEKEDKTLEDLKPFAKFNWLLKDQERNLVKDWLQEATGDVQSQPRAVCQAEAPSSAGGRKTGGGKKRKATDEAVLRAASQALFRN